MKKKKNQTAEKAKGRKITSQGRKVWNIFVMWSHISSVHFSEVTFCLPMSHRPSNLRQGFLANLQLAGFLLNTIILLVGYIQTPLA